MTTETLSASVIDTAAKQSATAFAPAAGAAAGGANPMVMLKSLHAFAFAHPVGIAAVVGGSIVLLAIGDAWGRRKARRQAAKAGRGGPVPEAR